MKQIRLFILLVLFSNAVAAQSGANAYAAIDNKALAIPAAKTKTTGDIAGYINANFRSDEDKVRAIFIWVASNLEYDVDNMFTMRYNETKEEKIAKALKTRRGICENYAAVFDDICSKCGLQSDIIVGFTKQPEYTSYLRHGWCAVKIENKWRLYDPTWGSGVIIDNKFTPKINNEYYDADPAMLIRTHMPFDPMWQMLYYPKSNREFTDGKATVSKSKTYFNYPDSIAAYEKMSEGGKYEAEARRLEQNGVNSEVVYDRLTNLKSNIDVLRNNDKVLKQNKVVDTYNEAIADLNKGVNDLNDFINYRNRQFTPMKPDAAIQEMLDAAEKHITRADAKLNSVKGGYDKVDELMGPVQKNLADVYKTMDDQKEWLKEYFSKGKLGRKTMFRKYTWMGIPLN